MTNETYLARKLAERADWAWAPGMAYSFGRSVLRCRDEPEWWPSRGSGYIPVLNDLATGGALLGRVRFGPDDTLYRVGQGWRFHRAGGGLLAGMSLGEVAAKAILLA